MKLQHVSRLSSRKRSNFSFAQKKHQFIREAKVQAHQLQNQGRGQTHDGIASKQLSFSKPTSIFVVKLHLVKNTSKCWLKLISNIFWSKNTCKNPGFDPKRPPPRSPSDRSVLSSPLPLRRPPRNSVPCGILESDQNTAPGKSAIFVGITEEMVRGKKKTWKWQTNVSYVGLEPELGLFPRFSVTEPRIGFTNSTLWPHLERCLLVTDI